VPADGGVSFGNYTLYRRLARGGMAEVFLARQGGLEGFERRVAVKRILQHLSGAEDFVRMFLVEARLAARLTHPNIVHIYELGQVDDDWFIAMEFVDGVHAGQLVKHAATEPVPPALVARIGADAAAALHYAHHFLDPDGAPLGLVHRDISPPNLMISYDGVVKLVDFGIAKALGSGDQTRPGVVKGKYTYMSPEQTIGKLLDGKSDVFSLGLVLWELLAGRHVVERGDPGEAMRAIRDGRIPPIEKVVPDVPRPLAAALARALVVRREDRCSAAELGQELEGFIKASPQLATPMQLGEWIRARFPRAATGPQPILDDIPDGEPLQPVTGNQQGAPDMGSVSIEVAMPARAASQPSVEVASALEASAAEPLASDDRHLVNESALTALDFEAETALIDLTATAVRVGRRRPQLWPWALAAGVAVAATAGALAVAERASERRTLIAARAAAARVVAGEPATVRPTTATLEVVTTPPGALVVIGEQRRRSPATFAGLTPGPIALAVHLPNRDPLRRQLALEAGERRTLDIQLSDAPAPLAVAAASPGKGAAPVRPAAAAQAVGYLTASTRPPSVVYLEGRRLGETPLDTVGVAPGVHTVAFKHPRRRTVFRKVVIKSGETTRLDVALTAKPR